MQTLTDTHQQNWLASRNWIRVAQLVAVALLMGLFCLVGFRTFAQPDPYVQDVLASHGNPERGESLFAQNCAACHGSFGDGQVGPSLRGLQSRRSEIFVIEQVTSGNTPPMPQFQPDPQSMADLLSYLNSL